MHTVRGSAPGQGVVLKCHGAYMIVSDDRLNKTEDALMTVYKVQTWSDVSVVASFPTFV